MTDLTLPPPDEPQRPKWLEMPIGMSVNGEGIPATWMVKHSTGVVWLWLRQPLNVYVQNFNPESAVAMAEALTEGAINAVELSENVSKLQAVRAPLFGPDGGVIQ